MPVNQKESEKSLLNWQFISKYSEAMLPTTSTKSKWGLVQCFPPSLKPLGHMK